MRHFSDICHTICGHACVKFKSYLCNKLDYFDEDVERHVSRDNTSRSLREQGGNDGGQTAKGKVGENHL